ncbi:hypothetical protein PV08_08611 [Exophiala spinifera]|uniref:Uncharacterized protein n=1 Tax=Exophiala spinifera TaxID=91928 RepID=A0A0D2B3F3_9EURO|nr:uncharacterized protein PV08_08611 [Exophiala spinifera]KIW13423.1 hypothetical protein PV08_08611 [Exophiala spinifera]
MSTSAATSGELVSHSHNNNDNSNSNSNRQTGNENNGGGGSSSSNNNNNHGEMGQVGGAVGAGSNHPRLVGPYDTRPPPPTTQHPPQPGGLVFNRGSTRAPALYTSTIRTIVPHVAIRQGHNVADRPYAYECEVCRRRNRKVQDFHRHMRQLEGREGFRLVRPVPQVEMTWYGVDDAGYRYRGPLLRLGQEPLSRRRR